MSTTRIGRARPLLAGLLLAACGNDNADALAEPRALEFTPAHVELPLRLVHRGDAPLPLSRLRIDHRDADWSAFTITDATLPRQIEPGGAVTLNLRVDVDHFTGPDHQPRPGAAALTLLAGGQPRQIPLRFSLPEPSAPVQFLRAGLLVGLAALGLALRRAPWSQILRTLAALAIAPLGLGLCFAASTLPLALADLEQCADGRGGIALQVLPHAEGLGLLIALYLWTGIAAAPTRTADLRRTLVLTLALVAAAAAGGSLDPQVLMQAQHGLRWGLWHQPLGALALLLASVDELQAAHHSSRLAARVAAIGLAAVFTTLYLGGPDLPGLLALPHATSIAAGLTVWLLKVAALTGLLSRVRPAMSFSWAVVPLAIAQILLSAWLARGA